MIVSASYRTDVPAFYGEWFMNRVRAGFCRSVNVHSRRSIRIDLSAGAVDGIVFWTKNAAPMMDGFGELKDRGYAFVVQHAVNGYPRALEAKVPPVEKSVETAVEVARRFGPRTLVWRYDPIAFTAMTPFGFHLENFGRIARMMKGATDQVVVSFMQVYPKILEPMAAATSGWNASVDADGRALPRGRAWWDPSADEKRRLLAMMAKTAAENGMAISICAQPELLVPGVSPAACVDARRLEDVGGAAIHAFRRGNREGCLCHESRDVGAYGTCLHGCAYCYAAGAPGEAVRRYGNHDPSSEYLFPPPPEFQEEGEPSGAPASAAAPRQMLLWRN